MSKEPNQPEQQPEVLLEKIKSLYETIEKSSIYNRPTDSTAKVYVELGNLIKPFQIGEQSTRTTATAIRILSVYKDSLDKKAEVQKEAFKIIDRYLEAVNEFLEDKKLEKIQQQENRFSSRLVAVKFDDGTVTGLQALSSG